MTVYIPFGHGGEDMNETKRIMPEGCSLIVIETCGGGHYFNKGENGNKELFEHKRITKFLKKHPERQHIFLNPKKYSKEINKIFDSAAIYGPGDRYPYLNYNLLLSWPYNLNECNDINYSGLVTLESFLSPSFTTKNIVTNLLTKEGEPAQPTNSKYPLLDFDSYDEHQIWLNNYMEIFKYSVYPDPNDITRYFNSTEERKQLISEIGLNESNEMHYIDYMAKYSFSKKLDISLETLMAKFPGHYIHIVCRSTPESMIGNQYNPHPDIDNTREEMAVYRIPGMTKRQRKRAIDHMNESRLLGVKSNYDVRSTKNIHNIMSAGLKKSFLHNELHSIANEHSNIKSGLLGKYYIPRSSNARSKLKPKGRLNTFKNYVSNKLKTVKNWKNYISDRITNSRRWRSNQSIASS